MNIFDRAGATVRPRLFAGIAGAGIVILILAGWCSPDAAPRIDLLTRRDVGLHLARGFLQTGGAVALPPDLDAAADADIGPLIASGHMGVFPDGTFRPETTMRIGEVLAVWARLWKSLHRENVAPAGSAPPSAGFDSRWRWAAEHLALLAEADAEAAAAVAASSPDAPASRDFWRYLPLPDGRRTAPPSTPDEPACPFDPRTTGLVIDAVTGRPLPGAVGTIDGKAFASDAHGRFRLPDGPTDAIRDVFVAVNGYRSLSFRWNPGLRPELKLSLKQFRAPVDVRVLTASGEPAPGISLSLPDAAACVTDDDGMARLRSIRPGYHRLRVAAPNKASTTMLISVAESGGVHTIRLPASFAF
ncbi:MAG TPA: hypothetical protein PLU72_10350 [Candidatus Ozemobacteraceae bacterium]|nr:hypothetical protein [Candidatus Ozemobacteraceae bacterium]HQG27943.1 hypothetical protein [Candidatus Ozemobacteraceae bacterium]